jgi:uncharacterized protein (DUF1330 family)
LKKLSCCIVLALLVSSEVVAHVTPVEQSPGYLLVLGRSTDRAKIIQYSTTLPPIYAATGGRYIGIGRPGGGVTCVYGLCEGRSAVVARWEDEKSVSAFWWSDAYRQAVKLRDNAGAFTVVGLKGVANVEPYASGALLVATLSGAAEPTSLAAWLASAAESGARLLTAPQTSVLTPLEGDALYNRVAMLSFASKEVRDKFAAADTTKLFIKITTGQSLIAILAIDAPVIAPPIAK